MEKHVISAKARKSEVIALDAAEEEAVLAEWSAWPPPPTAEDVRDEAERRLRAGLMLSSGVRFRLDDRSLNRIDAMTRSAIWPKTFRTADGVAVTLNNAAEAQAIFDEADQYATDVLAASAALQADVPADYAEDHHWPASGL